MKKQTAITTLICIIFFVGCASVQLPPKPKTDEDYYREAMVFFDAENFFETIPAFEKLREKFPLSPYAVLAELRLGDSHFIKEEYIEAVHYYETFRRLHPSNQNVPYSIYMTGMCYYKQILSPDRDQTAAKQAIEHFQLLVELFPTNPYTGKALCKIYEAKERVAAHEFFVGYFYLKQKNYRGAVDRFNRILKEYSHSIDKDRLLYYLAEATLLSGDNAKGARILKLLLKKYPEGDYSVEAKVLLDLHSSDEKEVSREAP